MSFQTLLGSEKKSAAEPRKTTADKLYGATNPAGTLAAEWGIDLSTAQKLLDIEKQGGVRRQPSDEEIEKNGSESMRLLRQEFGVRVDAIAVRIREIVAKRPALANALESSGAGNHHSLVLPLARSAARQLDAEEKIGFVKPEVRSPLR